MGSIAEFRWWLFKRLNAVIWKICPEPHKSNLERIVTVQWKDLVKDGTVDPAVQADVEARAAKNRFMLRALQEQAMRSRNGRPH
jgi:hypothetical protein